MISTSKDFIVGLKRNWSVENFAQHYGITPEEVITCVDRVFTTGNEASQIKKQLKINGKKHRPVNSKTKSAITVVKESSNIAESTSNFSDKSVETVVDTETFLSGVYEPHSKDFHSTGLKVNNQSQHLSSTSLSTLNSYEADLKEELCSTEILHKELITQKSSLMDKLKKERDKLAKLQAQLVEHKAIFDNFVSEYNTVTSNIANSNIELHFLQDELEATRKAIEEAKKRVTIYVYADSVIVPENFLGELPEVDAEMFRQFSVDERFEDLTLKELRQLCKLIAFVTILKNDGKQFECIFDHKKLETAYNSLTF